VFEKNNEVLKKMDKEKCGESFVHRLLNPQDCE